MNKEYNPYWPETVIFWGAGATASLGFRSTGSIQKGLLELSKDNNLLKRVDKVFGNAKPDIREGIIDLFIILGEAKVDSNEYNESISRQDISKFRAFELREIYDWNTLKELIDISTSRQSNEFQLYDLYNLIDLHITSGQGFHNLENRFIRVEKLEAARNMITLITVIMHSVDYYYSLKNRSREIKQYINFFKGLAEEMKMEGLEKSKRYELKSRDFYLFSYAVISMNWDPVLLWYIFNAHKELNDSNMSPNIGQPKVPMKLFHDFGHFMGVRRIDSKNLDIWYPMNESVVQRLNDENHETGRRVRVGKLYFPHGMHGFRECPNCGKLIAYLGDEWNFKSESLLPPLPLASLGNKCNARTEEELKEKKNRNDILQCMFCGTMTEFHHTTMIMQSAFKDSHPTFIEDIQRDMKLSLENAKHIIFFGYSLPDDDFMYKSILRARLSRSSKSLVCSVVGIDSKAPSKWMYGKELDDFLKENTRSNFSKTIKRAKDIFGLDVRAHGQGIPDIFLNETGGLDKMKLKKLMKF